MWSSQVSAGCAFRGTVTSQPLKEGIAKWGQYTVRVIYVSVSNLLHLMWPPVHTVQDNSFIKSNQVVHIPTLSSLIERLEVIMAYHFFCLHNKLSHIWAEHEEKAKRYCYCIYLFPWKKAKIRTSNRHGTGILFTCYMLQMWSSK